VIKKTVRSRQGVWRAEMLLEYFCSTAIFVRIRDSTNICPTIMDCGFANILQQGGNKGKFRRCRRCCGQILETGGVADLFVAQRGDASVVNGTKMQPMPKPAIMFAEQRCPSLICRLNCIKEAGQPNRRKSKSRQQAANQPAHQRADKKQRGKNAPNPAG